MLVLFPDCWERKLLTQVGLEKLNEDLHQPSGIRYVSRSFSVRFFISLAYWEGIDFCAYTIYCSIPQAIEIFLRNIFGDHTGEFLAISFGVFVGIQCSWIALISLFLCWVWGYVCPVVSYKSKFCLIFYVWLLFISFSSCTWVFLSQSRVHAGFPWIVVYARGFTENSRVCPDFCLFWEDYVLLGDFGLLLSLLGCFKSLDTPLFLMRDAF